MNAKDVITIGRRRIRQASTVASSNGVPFSFNSLANSTIRIAFFAANPTVTNRPTWKNTSLDSPRKAVAINAPITPRGTTKMTAIGIDQLSYSAAKHRNTTRIDRAYKAGACEPERRSS
ncbi:hypothetical protein D3C81_1985340 [compost metagenome]